MEKKEAKKLILNTIKEKSNIKQIVYDNTLSVFNILKEVSQQMSNEYNNEMKGMDERVLLDFKDRGAFEFEMKIAGDLLIFNMHSNIFEFDRGHGVWKTSYVQNNNLASYAGIINIYNFLYDSFKYNRLDDLGYLIARIFINKDNHFFVEGKRQLGFLYNNFENAVIDKSTLKNILESAILYALDFDLFVPPYEEASIVNVAQMKENINKSKIQTGKRLGFNFYVGDVSE
jgi:hypothetical protein